MADNANATAGDGTLVIAADDIGGVKYQRVKLNLGSDGVASDIDKGQQLKADSIPVVVASDQDAIPVDVNSALPAGSNNIGKIDVNSQPAGVLAGMTSLPAGTNVIGYVRVYRQYSNNTTLVPSASRGSGSSTPLSVALYNSLTAFLDVTVAPGTSLDVYIKSKDPLSGNYVTIGQFPQVTGTGTWQVPISGAALGSEIVYEWSVVGTNPTFSIASVLKG